MQKVLLFSTFVAAFITASAAAADSALANDNPASAAAFETAARARVAHRQLQEDTLNQLQEDTQHDTATVLRAHRQLTVNGTCQKAFLYFAVSAVFGNCADVKKTSACTTVCQSDIDYLFMSCACGDVFSVDDDTGEVSRWKPGSAEGVQLLTSKQCSIANDPCAGHINPAVAGLIAGGVSAFLVCAGGIAGCVACCCCFCDCCPVAQAKIKKAQSNEPSPGDNAGVAIPATNVVPTAAAPVAVAVVAEPYTQPAVQVTAQPATVQYAAQPAGAKSQLYATAAATSE